MSKRRKNKRTNQLRAKSHRSPVVGVPSWEDFARRFDGPMKQATLFDPGPAKPKPVRPSRDPLAAHNARVIQDWGRPYVPDPQFERPPWE